MVFKFVFALIYILKWNFRQWTNPYYRKGKTDVNEEFKKLRKDRNGAYSTDEDDDEEGGVFGKNENVGSDGHIFGEKGDGDITMRENPDIDDSDNDD